MASEFLRDILPSDAEEAGLLLLWHRDREHRESAILINKDRQALFSWPYVPSLTEVRDKAMEFLKKGGRNASMGDSD